MRKHVTDLSRGGGRVIFQRWPPTDARRRKVWRSEKPGIANETKLKGLVRDLKGTHRHLILRSKSTGAWLSVRGTTVSGTILSDTEFWNFLCACYNVSPLNPQSHCNGCGTAFGVMDTLSCSSGGLVIARHNKSRDEILYLARCAFTPASVRTKPLIHQGRTGS